MPATMEQLEAEYKQFVDLKADNKSLAESLVLLHQKTLTAAGKAHVAILAAGEDEEAFYATPLGCYYLDWRTMRATSVADMMGVSAMLGVHWDVEDIKGETFYAGIPCVTAQEVATAAEASGTYNAKKVVEMVGVDGQMHVFDALDGAYDPNDIYGDGSMVKAPVEEEQTTSEELCSMCKHADGDGKACESCNLWK